MCLFWIGNVFLNPNYIQFLFDSVELLWIWSIVLRIYVTFLFLMVRWKTIFCWFFLILRKSLTFTHQKFKKGHRILVSHLVEFEISYYHFTTVWQSGSICFKLWKYSYALHFFISVRMKTENGYVYFMYNPFTGLPDSDSDDFYDEDDERLSHKSNFL